MSSLAHIFGKGNILMVLATVKNSTVNKFFPILSIAEFPNYVYQIINSIPKCRNSEIKI